MNQEHNFNRANADYMNPALSAAERAELLLAHMTLEEKAAQIGSCWVYQLTEGGRFSDEKAQPIMENGIGQITRIGGASTMLPNECAETANQIQTWLLEHTRLGIPAIVHEEACSGVLARGGTVFPQTLGVACSWNRRMPEMMGEIIRRQMRSAGMHLALAPLMDVTRDPRWGRVEETYGEDPYMVSSMSTSFVTGLQGKSLKDGVAATGKHFVGYGASEGGMNWAPAHISERELREVYLTPFEAAVKKASMASIMPGYHELDGVPCHASKTLLRDTLRDKWHFDGIVVSDYFAISQLYSYHHLVENKTDAIAQALASGVDSELPNTDCAAEPLLDGVREGKIDMELLNQSVRHILKLKFELGLFENPFVDPDAAAAEFDTAEDRAAARKIAQESMVLLKNDGTLPLEKTYKTIAIVGPNADSVRNMLGDYTYPAHIESLIEVKVTDNALAQPVPDDVDTDHIHLPHMKSILSAIRDNLEGQTQILYAKGCDVLGSCTDGIEDAVKIASQADLVIAVLGDKAGVVEDCSTGETRDSSTLHLPGQQEQLFRAVAQTGAQLITVLINGRPYVLDEILEKSNAVLEAWLPGSEGAEAVCDVLMGRCNPGGHLAISFPRAVGQVPVFYAHKRSGGRSHWKGDYVDGSTKPLLPFGFGLSYTSFAYSDFEIESEEVPTTGSFKASICVQNTGNMPGDAVVQLYCADPVASVTRPVKELKGFARAHLACGQKVRVQFEVAASQMAFVDRGMRFVVEPGEIQVMFGEHAEKIAASGAVTLTGEKQYVDESREFFSQYTVKDMG